MTTLDEGHDMRIAHDTDEREFEPLLAGTFALMTFYPDQSTPVVARRIANNLLALARHPRCDSERMRHVLLRARSHWVERGRGDGDAGDGSEHAGRDPGSAAGDPHDADPGKLQDERHVERDADDDAFEVPRARRPLARLLRRAACGA